MAIQSSSSSRNRALVYGLMIFVLPALIGLTFALDSGYDHFLGAVLLAGGLLLAIGGFVSLLALRRIGPPKLIGQIVAALLVNLGGFPLIVLATNLGVEVYHNSAAVLAYAVWIALGLVAVGGWPFAVTWMMGRLSGWGRHGKPGKVASGC